MAIPGIQPPVHPPHGGGPPKKKIVSKKIEEEQGEDHSDANWIVSYADMMTLLCVFFVMLSALMQPDPGKMEEVRKEIIEYLGGTYQEPNKDLADKIQGIVKKEGIEELVRIDYDHKGITVTFRGTVFFPSGKAVLTPKGQELLDKMAGVIARESPTAKISVEGHTDDVPIRSRVYPSNWELSGARASRVIRLFQGYGFQKKLLTAIGFADTRPIVPNRDDQGVPIINNQAQNRRVVLRVLNIITNE